jgi:hypothetical protein
MRTLWTEPDRRAEAGQALIERASANHSETRYTRELLELYARVRSMRSTSAQ